MCERRKHVRVVLFVFVASVCLFAAATMEASVKKKVPKSAKDGLFYMWLFDEGVAGHQFSTIYDTENYWKEEYKTNFYQDTFKGNFEYPEGVSGTCAKFDGFTTRIVRTYIKVPDLTDAFSLECWIAPQATRNAALVSQEKDSKRGFIFGLFGGRLGIQMAVDGKWVQCTSDLSVPVRKWSHVAVTFHKDEGINLYLNGTGVGRLAVKGTMTDARRENLLIGMSGPKQIKLRESGGKFPPIEKKLYHHMAYDGLIDELKLYEEALSSEDIKDLYNQVKPKKDPPLERRLRPVAPKLDNAEFGASYGRLRYYDEYEDTLRIGDFADVIVRFDLLPVTLMFAHTDQYIPVWATENGKLIGDQSVEINAKNGFYEVMMDKQNRYSHVRILENSDARAVIHWRYALCDRFYEIARPDEMTNWGDWVDEYFMVYPDGVVVRHWTYYTSTFGEDYLQFQETILHPQPGQTCDADVEVKALTLMNMKGQSYTYSWADGVPPYFPEPEAANIQLVNTKSRYRPFIIFEPGSQIDKYIWGYRKDRGYHVSSCLASGLPLIHKGKARDSYVAVALYGMTDRDITRLLPLAESWINPPALKLKSLGFLSRGYDKYQRAYLIEAQGRGKAHRLEFELAASADSPVVNPAFVISNWSAAGASVTVNGKTIADSKALRIGRRRTFQGSDLVLWIKLNTAKSINVEVVPEDD